MKENYQALISHVEHTIRELDQNVIVQRTFYDSVSDRLFVGVVRGQRKIDIMIRVSLYKEGTISTIDREIKRALESLRRQPIG